MASTKILKKNWQRIHDVPRGYLVSMLLTLFRLNEMGKNCSHFYEATFAQQGMRVNRNKKLQRFCSKFWVHS